MNELANVGDFCPNEACPDYGRLQKKQSKQNIKKHGFTAGGIQRFQCRTCGQTFTATKGTPFYRRRTDSKEILETLAFLAEGVRISSVARVKGHKEDTILEWLKDAATHAAEIEAVLLADRPSPMAGVAFGKLWSKYMVKRHPIQGVVGHPRLSNRAKIGNICKWSNNGKTAGSSVLNYGSFMVMKRKCWPY
jgi:transposase-like protein